VLINTDTKIERTLIKERGCNHFSFLFQALGSWGVAVSQRVCSVAVLSFPLEVEAASRDIPYGVLRIGIWYSKSVFPLSSSDS